MNRRLVICLGLSIISGSLCTGMALHAGFGWLAALGIYSLTGTMSLVGLSGLALALDGSERPATRPATSMADLSYHRT